MLSPFIVVLSALLPISFDLRPDFANIQSESGGVNGVCLTPKRIIWLIKLFLYVAFVGLLFGFFFLSLSLCFVFLANGHGGQYKSENTVTIALNCIIARARPRAELQRTLQRFQERCSSNKSLSSVEHCPLPLTILTGPETRSCGPYADLI